ncbi:phage holin [Paenibacillus sp. RUD330]|uniref:phage holin n=1 Tax=Paenibacillus sp. RUD330 TaxID=2023772 RepID=UPI000B9269D4|nr:phage holin [Paenibacillus sp. RUD330]ASS64692.1 phage holin [Paenibacillus sp. RUD330]
MSIQPAIDAVVQSIIGLLAAAVVAWVAMTRKRVEAWLDARTTEQQRAVLHKMAAEAVAYVEATADSPGARDKFLEARQYLQDNLPAPIVDALKDKEIQAAIEKALYELKAGIVTPQVGVQHGQ